MFTFNICSTFYLTFSYSSLQQYPCIARPSTSILNVGIITHPHNTQLSTILLALFRVNLLVIQHLETLYLGGNHVRAVRERV